jgi:hypothetical protein
MEKGGKNSMQKQQSEPAFGTALAVATLLNERCDTKEEALASLEVVKRILALGFDNSAE